VTVQVRHPRRDESAAAAAVLNEHSRRLHGTDNITAAELDETWSAPELKFPDDVFVAEANGSLIGYADVIPFGDTSWLDVRSIDAGAYEPLLDASIRRAQAHAKAHVRAWANEKDSDSIAAHERSAFRSFRHSFRMEIELGGDLPEPAWPDGFAVRAYREGDAQAFHRAQMDSFADTWGFTEEPYEPWTHWMMGERFQPEHWFLVETRGDVAAIALCRVSDTEPNLGWVDILGVLPAYRRRGLAIGLLRLVFRHFADQGLERVGLSVDAENPTGAVRLYERAGMHVARRDIRYELVRDGRDELDRVDR
jgi:mycothiol synthase